MNDSGYYDIIPLIAMDTITPRTVSDNRVAYSDWSRMDDSGVDLLCREDMSMWSPYPPAYPMTVGSTSGRFKVLPTSPSEKSRNRKAPRARRKLSRLDKKKINRTPLRRSERLRNKSRSSSGTPIAERANAKHNRPKTSGACAQSPLDSHSKCDRQSSSVPCVSPDVDMSYRTLMNAHKLVNPYASPKEDPATYGEVTVSSSTSSSESTWEYRPIDTPCSSPSYHTPQCPESPDVCPTNGRPHRPQPFAEQFIPSTTPAHMTIPFSEHSASSDENEMSPIVPCVYTLQESSDRGDDLSRDEQLALVIFEFDHYGFTEHQIDTYLHKRDCELRYHPVESLANQSQVTPGMRAVLAEWLTKIHHSMELKFDGLFLAMNIVDRFLVTTPIASSCVQLLGLTAILVASKMNEIFPPTIPELLKTSCEKYSKDQMRQLERLVLVRLKFDLLAPTSIYFLEHYAADRIRLDGCSTRDIMKARVLARYLLELSLQDYTLVQFQPSILGLVALDQSEVLLEQNTRKLPLSAFGHAPSSIMECIAEFQPIIDGLLTNGFDVDALVDRYTLVFGSPDDPYNK